MGTAKVLDGSSGAGIYVFNRGHLGTNLGNGFVFGGPANPTGVSLNGSPVFKATAANQPPKGNLLTRLLSTIVNFFIGRLGAPSFTSEDDAAKSVINGVNPTSVSQNREHAGLVVQNPDGTYSYTGPNPGTVDTSWPGNPPPFTSTVDDWHTHGGPDPRYDNEHFSPPDMQGNTDLGYPGYLGTPSGAIYKYYPPARGGNPNDGNVVVIQPPGGG